MNRGIRVALTASAVALVVATPTHAAPLVGASDTATPNYVSSFTPTAGENEFRCEGGGCSLTITTKTSPYPCASELVVLSDVPAPALLYRDTFCAVSITGEFELPLAQDSPVCVLEAAQTLRVSFSSGANSAFNGTFPATGSFKPTATTSSGHITAASVSVKAGGPFEAGTGTGVVKATFQVRFGGAGLNPFCRATSPSGLSTVSAGTVVARI